MEKVFTSKDVCRQLKIPFYRLQYLFDSGKLRDVSRTTTGDRIYTDEDIKIIKEALFEVER